MATKIDVKAETSKNVEKDVKAETSNDVEKDVKAVTSKNVEKDVQAEIAESSKNVEKVKKADETSVKEEEVADETSVKEEEVADETSVKEEEVADETSVEQEEVADETSVEEEEVADETSVKEEEEPAVVMKKVVLKSNDNETFEVDEEVAMQSETIKQMLEDDVERSIIPIPNVRSDILAEVIEYCRHKVKEDKEPSIHYEPNWEKNYFMKMDNNTAIAVVLAANYLNIKSLLDLCCKSIADTIKDMSVEEVRNYMNIKNDLTPEEEAKIRQEHEWAHEI